MATRKKMTRAEYRVRRVELFRRLTVLDSMLKTMPKAREVLDLTADDLKPTATEVELESLWEMSIAFGENLNALHDLKAMVDKQLADLDDEWDRRDWTAADYANAALVMANID